MSECMQENKLTLMQPLKLRFFLQFLVFQEDFLLYGVFDFLELSSLQISCTDIPRRTRISKISAVSGL